MTSAILATFSDVIGFLAQSFRLAAVFPAFIFVLLNEVLILPRLSQEGLVEQLVALDVAGKLVIAAVCSLLLGYTLTIVNIPLIRLFEGYPWRTTWLGGFFVRRQEARRKELEGRNPRLERKITRLNKQIRRYEVGHRRRDRLVKRRRALNGWLKMERRLREQEIRDYFPDETSTLPTTMGNTIAAFEDYPWTRYGIDAVVLWPRLLPTLTKENYAAYVEREKAALDFALNICFLLLVLGLEIVYVGLLFGEDSVDWVIAICSVLLFAYGVYRVAAVAAYNWGTTVRVAFDLYRYHLLRALYGRPPHSFSAERKMWQRISQFVREGVGSEEGELREQDVDALLLYSRVKRDVKEQQPPPVSDGGER
jgi:hypothetical protein